MLSGSGWGMVPGYRRVSKCIDRRSVHVFSNDCILGWSVSGSSCVRGSCTVVDLLFDRASLVCFSELRETHIVLFLVCPSLDFPPPRNSGHPKIILCVLPTRSEGGSVNCSIRFSNLN